MNSFYSYEELMALGFQKVGKNVLISKKASFYGIGNISIGDYVRIDDFCILSGMITLGSYVHISAYAVLYGGTAGITVEDFANISTRSTVFAVCDDFTGAAMAGAMVPPECRLVDERPVLIKKHVVVGAHCVVLPGITLSEGSAFGACSLINKDSLPWSLNAGVPFRKMRDREKKPLILELQILDNAASADTV